MFHDFAVWNIMLNFVPFYKCRLIKLMRVYIVILFCFCSLLQLNAENFNKLYSDLETVLDKRDYYSRKKELRIDSIRSMISNDMSYVELFRKYHEMYEEYLTYRSDSALYYIDKAEAIAEKTGNEYQKNLSRISRSNLLATSGYFSQALELLNKIDKNKLDRTLLVEYYKAYEWVYSVWSEYSNDEYFTPEYKKKEIEYNDSLLKVLSHKSQEYYYWLGEYKSRTGDPQGAQKAYELALKNLSVNTRLYACVTCGLAFAHKYQGNLKDFEKYLILSAISDNVCPLKENLAMQELALHIYMKKDGSLERANRYLNYSMEDAVFYVNRLRMLEIARKFPSIVNAYQMENLEKSDRLAFAVYVISALMLIVVILLVFNWMRLKQVKMSKLEVDTLNRKLKELNDELLKTNNTREEYMSLFLELCAAYIEKLNRYQDLVKRKVKAKQTDDLLKLSNNKMSESDAKRFFVNFDTSFIKLYPNFVNEFNNLLREGEEIYPDKGGILNTELRIFALIRLGIKDSSSISTLLFYSPQTIYNYRSAVRNKAKNRDEFEEQVRKLCLTM